MPGVRDWLAKASGDLKSAKKLIKDDDDTLYSAAYFTQQSVEKSFKTYLISKQKTVPRTHDLEKLLIDCIALDKTFDQLRSAAEDLSPYATYTRYPDDRFFIDRTEVMAAIQAAEKVLKFVKTKLEVCEKIPQLNLFEN